MYVANFTFGLGSLDTGLSFSIVFVNGSGGSGTLPGASTVVELGGGWYQVAQPLDEAAAGSLVIRNTATSEVLACFAVNPRELANADVAASTRSTPGDILAIPGRQIVTDTSGRVDVGSVRGIDASAWGAFILGTTLGAVNDVAATQTSFLTNLTEPAGGAWDGVVLVFYTGANRGKGRAVTGYDPTGGRVSFAKAFPAIPSSTDLFFLTGYVDLS